jgi:cysteine-rich repeat protein
VGEGEGEGDVGEGEGEGEGDVGEGEGEGDVGEGEGEGEGDVGEGEGEGDVGEGEGEGEGEGDTCADVVDALDVVAFERHCYATFAVAESWVDAARRCATLGGYLAVPSTVAEDDFTASLTPPGFELMLGITDAAAEGSFVSLVDEQHSFGAALPFRAGEPNDGPPSEECVNQFGNSNGWNDIGCTGVAQFGSGNFASALCELPLLGRTFCGDAVVQRGLGEDCDDGNDLDGDGCDADCGSTSNAAAAVDLYGDRLLVAFAESLPYDDASLACAVFGGTLAVPDDPLFDLVVHALATRIGRDVWIGYEDRAEEAGNSAAAFVRVDTREPIGSAYSNFALGEPDDGIVGVAEDCVALGASFGQWGDEECDDDNGFVCAF